MTSDALGVVATWRTDQGPVEIRTWVGTPDGEAVEVALRGMETQLRNAGYFPLGVSRLYTQPVPVVDGRAWWSQAGEVTRLPVAGISVRQEMLG